MTSPRVVCVTRRFWPLVGGAETVMARLAAAFNERGAKATILTARWRRDWPEEIEHRGVRVVRLANPAVRFWGTYRYTRAMGNWLARHRQEFDIVYVSMLKHDAYAAVGAGREHGFPVALRAEGAGLSGDCHWHLRATAGARIKRRTLRAGAFVAPSAAIERELVAAGYARDRIHFIPNGVPLPPPVDAARKAEARAALAEHSRALTVEADAPAALFTGRLDQAKGLGELVLAWREVIERHPRARLWLVGDGDYRERLAEMIESLGLRGGVVLAGAFDEVDDFLAAADLFVFPSHEEGMSMALLEAMAAGLPIVASDIPGNRSLIENGRHGRLVPKQSHAALATAMLELIDDRAKGAELGAAARRRVINEFSIDRAVEAHLRLFADLLDRGGVR